MNHLQVVTSPWPTKLWSLLWETREWNNLSSILYLVYYITIFILGLCLPSFCDYTVPGRKFSFVFFEWQTRGFMMCFSLSSSSLSPFKHVTFDAQFRSTMLRHMGEGRRLEGCTCSAHVQYHSLQAEMHTCVSHLIGKKKKKHQQMKTAKFIRLSLKTRCWWRQTFL